jgi:hypothetical protein
MKHVVETLKLPWDRDAANGVRVSVGIGIGLSGPLWTVSLAWREEDRIIHWTKIISQKDMSEPSGFLDYTSFTWRLFCYAKLFKEAIKQFVSEVKYAPLRFVLACCSHFG